MPPTTAIVLGIRNARWRLPGEVRRQASNGPTPLRKSSPRPIGIIMVLNQGGPTVILTPCIHSENTGSIVPNRTAKQAATNNRLLNMKPLSRDTNDSMAFSLFK